MNEKKLRDLDVSKYFLKDIKEKKEIIEILNSELSSRSEDLSKGILETLKYAVETCYTAITRFKGTKFYEEKLKPRFNNFLKRISPEVLKELDLTLESES